MKMKEIKCPYFDESEYTDFREYEFQCDRFMDDIPLKPAIEKRQGKTVVVLESRCDRCKRNWLKSREDIKKEKTK